MTRFDKKLHQYGFVEKLNSGLWTGLQNGLCTGVATHFMQYPLATISLTMRLPVLLVTGMRFINRWHHFTVVTVGTGYRGLVLTKFSIYGATTDRSVGSYNFSPFICITKHIKLFKCLV